MNKTKVKVIREGNQIELKIGDIGYIDGYIRGADGTPLLAVVCGKHVDLLMPHQVEVIE